MRVFSNFGTTLRVAVQVHLANMMILDAIELRVYVVESPPNLLEDYWRATNLIFRHKNAILA